MERFRLSMQGIDLAGMEYHLIRKDGSRFPVMIYSNPIVRDGKIVGMRGIAIDITDRKRVEDEIRRTNEILVRERERLAKANIALEEILDKTEERTDKVKRQITTNLERVLDPHIKRLKTKLPDELVNDFDMLVQEIRDVTDPWVPTLEHAYDKLSHREIEVCNLIRTGLTSKEIGEQLNISAETVQKHRAKIRDKLGIKNKSTNLRTFLRLRFKTED
jgi:DNA-binding CsgD family transcriptional regulator